MRSHWTPIGLIQGHIAMWAVRQSPYKNPEGLNCVMKSFRKNALPRMDRSEMGCFTRSELEQFIRDCLAPIPEFIKWNDRKNGRDGWGVTSAYDKPNPDDDFIDLDALIRNSAASVWKEITTTQTKGHQ